MAYDRQSLKVSYLFAIEDTEEIAETGHHMTGASTAYDAAAVLAGLTTGQLLAFATRMVTLMNAGGLSWGDYSQFTAVKVAAVDVDGHYLGEPRVYTEGTPISQGGDTGVLPQASVVASLRSGFTFGQANYGRMYLPHTAFNTMDGPYGLAANADSVAAALDVFVTATNTAGLAFGTASDIRIMSAQSTGNAKSVARVAIGNVVDTQRRRRNRLNEVYSFSTI